MARIETTPAVKVALYALRVYLIILLLLIVVKFLRLFPAHPNPPKKTAVVTMVGALQPPAVSAPVESSAIDRA